MQRPKRQLLQARARCSALELGPGFPHLKEGAPCEGCSLLYGSRHAASSDVAASSQLRVYPLAIHFLQGFDFHVM